MLHLHDSFGVFYTVFLPKHSLSKIEGSFLAHNLGECESFENGDFRLQLVIDRGIPSVHVSRTGAEEWLLAERLLCFLNSSLKEPMDPKALAIEMDNNYDSLRQFFQPACYAENERHYKKFAMDVVASQHPSWNLEKTERWKDLHRD